MSSEGVNQKKSFGSNVMSVVAFPVGMSAAGGVKSAIRNKGIKNALEARNKAGFTTLKGALEGDCFSRGLALEDNYKEYNNLAKKAAKLAKKADKGKVSLLNRFKNIFRKNKVTVETLKENSKQANEALKNANDALKNGKQIIATTGEAVKTGFMGNVGNLIKKGFKDKTVWFFTAVETLPDVIKKVIPAFKEKGIVEGLKETGKTLLKAGGNMASYVAGSAVGRVIGTAIGTIFCPGAGSAVGGSIGSMIGVSLSSIVKGKIFKHDTKQEIVDKVIANPEKVKTSLMA